MKNQMIIFVIVIFSTVLIANGATYTVTKTADTNDGVCDADCSLREAIQQVNLTPAGAFPHVIDFSSLFNTAQTIALSSRIEIVYDTHVQIIGTGTNFTNPFITITAASGSDDGLLEINSDYALVSKLRFADSANLLTPGGALRGDDGVEIRIQNCVFENNTASVGGAVDLRAFQTVEITSSIFRNNSAATGGAIFLQNYNQAIYASTFEGNQADGGAVVLFSGFGFFTSGQLVVSTFSGNTSTSGAIIQAGHGFLGMDSITVANNTSVGQAIQGSGIASSPVSSITNSIVALNSGGNISPLISATANYTGSDVLLGPLGPNGGFTETRAPLLGSPAIDSGSGIQVLDQRGAARPQGFGMDIGAVEIGGHWDSASTPNGMNTNVIMGGVSITYSGVSTSGTTTRTPINPTSAGTLPGGFSLGAGYPAFEIFTSAVYTGPITVCIQVSQSTPLTQFNSLRILHNEGGTLVDRTILAPSSPAPNFATKTICGLVTSLSPFVVAQNLAPTAAGVSVSGKVIAQTGAGISRAVVSLTDVSGSVRTVVSNQFGYFVFDDLELGIYVADVSSKEFTFASQVLNISDSVSNINLTAINPTTPNKQTVKRENK